MLEKKVNLFKLLGFKVSIDLSWLILGLLVAWTLAGSVFPHYYTGLSVSVYWLMGAAGAAGLFFSILFHELSHSIVARKFGISIRGITLFIFGGVAQMEDEPPSAKAEFFMALAGPASSILLGLALYLIYLVALFAGWPVHVAGVLNWLGAVNLVLAVFNMIPAFPLDGGRVLRAGLWAWKKDLRRATRIASWVGRAFGTLLIVLGAASVLARDFVSGIWLFLIGLYMRNAAQLSYRQVLARSQLEGEKISRFMNPEPVTVPADATVDEFIEDYVYRHHYKLYPVVKDGGLAGCVTIDQVRKVTKKERGTRTVGELAADCDGGNSIRPDEDAMKVLSKMRGANRSRLMVVEDGKLVGIVALKDLVYSLSVKADLE